MTRDFTSFFLPSFIAMYRFNANFKFLLFDLVSHHLTFHSFCLFVKLDTYLAYLSQISTYSNDRTPEFDCKPFHWYGILLCNQKVCGSIPHLSRDLFFATLISDHLQSFARKATSIHHPRDILSFILKHGIPNGNWNLKYHKNLPKKKILWVFLTYFGVSY